MTRCRVSALRLPEECDPPHAMASGSSPSRSSPILDSMERVKIAGVLYRLVREQAKKSPRVVAVLERALGEYETYAARTDWRGRRQFAEVEAWFMSDEARWPFSFVAICEALGLDLPSVRAGLRSGHVRARRVALHAIGRS